MKVVYKYRSNQIIELPEDSHVLCVQVQNNNPVIYIRLDKDAPVTRRLCVVRVTTGTSIPEGYGHYLGTAMLDGGAYVEHLYGRYERI